jgi:uncharacterized protein YbcC (UPF0753/DUF2309 family)
LKDFVHHNTLHAFQDQEFHNALAKANAIFGYKTYLSLVEFRNRFAKNEIKELVLNHVISKSKGIENIESWKQKLLHQPYDESVQPRIGNLRANWKKEYAINLEKSTHSLLFRVLCSYLDQGIAIDAFPYNENGLFSSLLAFEKKSFSSFFKSKRVVKLLKDDDIKRFITRLIKFRQILFSSVQKSPKLIKDISLARNRFASFKLKYIDAMMNE